MGVRVESNAEPLPGYRLIERLGGGGFGEVWKAEAPGGMFKAIKFVYGDLEAADEEGARAGQEFKALKRVITVRHPFILSVERFDIIDGQLIIVTELADRTLWDRFRECRVQGLPGIPREELHRYLDDTAEALDLMNTEHQLQHLDIKPQNLFLVHNHVKVADFGLVKDLEGMLASVTGGVTPVYAAPETFEGKVSRFSDQYSLAIVYQELLTGQRPYSGTTLRQLVMQHCQGTPDLKSLPKDDQPIILRALAKHHEDRFPSCRALVQALHNAGQTQVTPAALVRQPVPVERGSKESASDGEKTQSNQARTAQTAPAAAPTGSEPAPAAIADKSAEPAATPRKSGRVSLKEKIGADKAPAAQAEREPAASTKGQALLVPTVVLGLGTLGLATLRQLRKETFDSFGLPEVFPSLRMLYIDTDPQVALCATRGRDQVALRTNEVLVARLHRPSHYIRPRGGNSGLERWFPAKMVYRMPRQQTACGVRVLGRLAFADSFKSIGRRLEDELQACCAKQALDKVARETGLTPRSAVPRVYIVTSLAGGTGSGMFIDLAYLARQKLKQLGHEEAEVVGLCFLPPAQKDARRTPELANTFAALTELNHFSAKHTVFTAQYELGEVRDNAPQFTWKGPPLDRCLFFTLPEAPEATLTDEAFGGLTLTAGLAKLTSNAARLIFEDCTSALGRAADEIRHQGESATQHQSTQGLGPGARSVRGPLYQTAGLYRLVWPRRQLLDQAAYIVCRRVVERWMSKNAKPLAEAVKEWANEQWEQNGFTADQLIARYQQACEAALGQAPESAFQAIHQPVATALAPRTSKASEAIPNFAVVMDAMEKLEQLVGVPEECRPQTPVGEPNNYQPGSLETILQETGEKVVDQFEQKLAELAVCLIEDPNYRLAGAEEALRQMRRHVEKALEAHEQLALELQHRATALYQRIHALTETPGQSTHSSTWKPPFAKRGPGGTAAVIGELVELLKAYPKCSYQGLVMQRITALYVSLRGLLSDQLREVDFCRARLQDLAAVFTEANVKIGPKQAPARAATCLPTAANRWMRRSSNWNAVSAPRSWWSSTSACKP